MQSVHELWITRLFNEYLAGLATPLVRAVGHHPTAEGPWTDWMVCELVVFLFIIVFFALARRSFSVDRPGRVQHTLEVIYEFLHAQAEESAPHVGPRYLAFFGTLFIFILFMNLIGLIPGFDSPTMFPEVPAGLAVATFFFYNAIGVDHKRRQLLTRLSGARALDGPVDDSDRNSESFCAAAVTDHSFVRQHVRRRAGLSDLYSPNIRNRSRYIYRPAFIRRRFAGIHLYSAGDDLRRPATAHEH